MTANMRRFAARAASAFIALAVPAFCAFAQTTTARVAGSITDPTGALIHGAVITVHNEVTGEDRVATAEDGAFTVFSLRPAVYDLRATAPGFATTELKSLTLAVGQEFDWKPVLTISSDTATVTVDASQVSLLDTSSARVGAVIPTREIQSLPLNGRQISQLYLLVPGATNAGTGTFDNIHFSGRSVEQNIIRIDGIDAGSIIDSSPGNLNGELTSLFRLQQSLEAVQEFRVDSSSYPAEMGTGTGGQISFISRSGTSNLHGSAFEYLRNDFFDARNDFNRINVNGNSPKFRLNQFGGSLGGPLYRDKLFGFATYEGLRQIYASAFTASTLSNFAKSQVPVTSAVYPLLAAYPVDPNPISSEQQYVNAAGAFVPGVLTASVTAIRPNSVREDFGMLRLDYHFNDRYTMYGRFNLDRGVSSQTQDLSGSIFGQNEIPFNGVLALNQALTPRVFNETKFGFNGVKMRVTGLTGASPSADLSASRIAIGGGLTNVGSLISLSSSFNGVGAPYTGNSQGYIDNLSIVRGTHSLKFGAEVRPLLLWNNQVGGTTYTYNSIGSINYDPVTHVPLGVAAGSGFLSDTTSMVQFYGTLSDLSPFTGLSGNAEVKQAYYIGYAEDEWKPTPNLTLSYGLRLEYYSMLHEVRGKDVVFNIPAGTITPGANFGYGTSVNNYGPRFGLTYAPPSLNGKTVLRAGAGIFYGPGQTEDQIQPEANDRVTKTFTGGSATNAASNIGTYPINPATDVYQFYNINSPTLGYQPRAYAPGYVVPERVGTFTVSVEQQLPGRFEAMVGYVGSVGRNLFLRSITNRITGVYENPTTGAGTAIREFTVGGTPTVVNGSGGITTAGAPGTNRFAEIDYKTSHGHDSYHSLQSSLQRRTQSGLTLGAQYTFAHELGTSSGSNEATTAQNPYDFSTEYGRGTFDIRHSANISVLYALPVGPGKRFLTTHPVIASVVGFEVGGILNARSGVPMDVLITRPDLAYVGNAGTPYAGQTFSAPFCLNGATVVTACTTGTLATTAVVNVPGGGNTRNIRRPNRVPGVSPFLHAGNQYLNPAAFSTPAPGTFGNAQRNALSGPSLTQFDLTLRKSFPIAERVNGLFQVDAYNILNHPNFANPGNIRLAQSIPASPLTATNLQPGTPFSSTNAGTLFGAYSSTVGNQVGLGTNRQLQLSLRVNF